ncbi:hypothetical protein DV515_00011279 [Chloebia gouldiae]|uniref:Uncharacterized protein n=1 Tax=Chloebia gouldiae TaxID=44316 RepID=A0A3L8S711_CHLGU|nr:hypothetical protein DV515_00011279 [Chloebia gouldiae]
MIKSSWFYVKFKHAEKIREQRRARAAGCGSNFSTVQVSVSQFTVRVRPYGVYLDEQKGHDADKGLNVLFRLLFASLQRYFLAMFQKCDRDVPPVL